MGAATVALLAWLVAADPLRADERIAPRVVVEDGLISASFVATPASAVVEAIRITTGVELHLPSSALARPVTLTITRAPLEEFLRRSVAAFDLGGFALVYEASGAADRAIVVAKSQGPAASAPPPPPIHTARPRPVPVPLLIGTSEAHSMKLGGPGQMLVVQSRPVGRRQTNDCGIKGGEFPVQTVLVTTATGTWVTSVTVCRAEALAPGETLAVAPGLSPGASGATSTFTATTQGGR